MMKRNLALFLVFTMFAIPLLSACGVTSSPAQTTTAPPATAATTANVEQATTQDQVIPEIEPLKLQFSHQLAATHTIHTIGLKMNELMMEKSGGKMSVEIFEAATLGTERENAEALSAGTLDLASVAISFYASYVPEVAVLTLPYLFDSYDHCYNAYNGAMGEKIQDMILDVSDVKILNFVVMPFRQIFTRDKKIQSVADVAGLKIRVPETPIYQSTFKMLGAAPTPVAWGEVYTAMDTGVVAGLENTPESVLSASLNEVANYMNMSNHITEPTTISMSNKVFNSLSPIQQQILIESVKEASEFGYQLFMENDTKAREALLDSLEVIEVDMNSMRSAVVYEQFDVMALEGAKEIKDLIDKAR